MRWACSACSGSAATRRRGRGCTSCAARWCCPAASCWPATVEVDESYIGGSRPGKRGRGAAGKAIVVIAFEDHDGAPGRTRMARVPDVKRETLTDFVLDHVGRGAEVRTDAYHGYNDVGRHRFSHVVVNVKESGDPAHVVMPQRPPRRRAAQALAARALHQGATPTPAGLLPRRVHLPLQPPHAHATAGCSSTG